MSVPTSVRGRGRGIRGRTRVILADIISKPDGSVEDVPDGCVAHPLQNGLRFADRYDDEISGGVKDLSIGKAALQSSFIDAAVGGSSLATPTEKKLVTAPLVEEEEGKILVQVLSVDLIEKCAEMRFLAKQLVAKCKVRLHQCPVMMQWMEENHLVFKNESLVESSLVSALEMNVGQGFIARKVCADPEGIYSVVTIDIFSFEKLRTDFLSSLVFLMVPRLPPVNQTKIGVITNLREAGEIDVVFYEEVWLSLREALHDLQIKHKLIVPRCAVLQELFKEMIEGFNAQYFLAPLGDDWRELHRVKIIGLEYDHMVRVLYVDIGKQLAIKVKNLSAPLPANFMPELLDKIPPQAVTLRLDNLNPKSLAALKTLRPTLEGRVCYVQTSDDSEKLSLPIVDIFVANSFGSGTVSLSNLAHSIATYGASTNITTHNQESLKTIQNKLDGLMRDWQESISKEISSGDHPQCVCCQAKKLGTCGGKTFPSVQRTIITESMCTG